MPLSLNENSQNSPSLRGRDRDPGRLVRRGTSARCRPGSGTRRSAARPRRAPRAVRPPRSSACVRRPSAARFAQAWASSTAQDTGSRRCAVRPDPAEREQVVDQRLHPLGAVDREARCTGRPCRRAGPRSGAAATGRSWPPCAAAPAGRARRRRRTARVRSWTAAGPPSWPPGSRCAACDGRQFRQDALPHPVHVKPHGPHLGRAARLHLVLEVARRPPGGRPRRAGTAAGSPIATVRTPAPARWPAARPR